jgi:hypothetical protein
MARFFDRRRFFASDFAFFDMTPPDRKATGVRRTPVDRLKPVGLGQRRA